MYLIFSGETLHVIKEFKVKTYREDLAIIDIVTLNPDAMVKGFIEVTLTTSQYLLCEISKLTETLLYAYYQLLLYNQPGLSIISVLSDFQTWHVFKVSLNRMNKVVIEGYLKKCFDSSSNDFDKDLLRFIFGFLKLLV